MGTADHPIRSAADVIRESDPAQEEWIKSSELIGAGAPGVTDLAADINAGPGEDRRRR
jgi:hypothetical protein